MAQDLSRPDLRGFRRYTDSLILGWPGEPKTPRWARRERSRWGVRIRRQNKRVPHGLAGSIRPEWLDELAKTVTSCPYCGCKLTTKNRQIDHLIPLIRGGTHARHNLTFACGPCNRDKGTRTAEEYLVHLRPFVPKVIVRKRNRRGESNGDDVPDVRAKSGGLEREGAGARGVAGLPRGGDELRAEVAQAVPEARE